MTSSTVALPGSVDVHAHVLDADRPAVPGAAYEMFPAPFHHYRRHLDQLGIDCGVLVTASIHGTDNEPMLRALAQDPSRLRGVAVIDSSVSDDELLRLHRRGVRGVRLQNRMNGGVALSQLPSIADRIAELGWHIELMTDLVDVLEDVVPLIARSPVPVVLDHFGFLPADIAPRSRKIDTMVGLARDLRVWITMSGAYRLAPHVSPADSGKALHARVEVLAEAVPDRLLWASDWPYVAPPGLPPTAEEQAAELRLWLSDTALRNQILVTNPRDCYSFADHAPGHASLSAN